MVALKPGLDLTPAPAAVLQTWTLPEPDRWDVDHLRQRVDVLVDSLSSVGVSHPVSSRPGTDAAASPAANSPAAAITATIAG